MLVSDAADPVRIEIQPDLQQANTVVSGGNKADVMVSTLNCVIPVDTVHHNTLEHPEMTVGSMIELLEQAGKHRCEFTPEGIRCRKWTTDILTLLADQRWIDEGAAVDAKKDIQKLWPDDTPLELAPALTIHERTEANDVDKTAM